MYPEEGLAAARGGERKNWRHMLAQSWKSTDLVHVIARKVLLYYGLLVGMSTLFLLAAEVNGTRQELSTRHAELRSATAKSLSEALWTYNDNLLNSMAFGLVQDPAITGARIRSEDGRTVHEVGVVTGSRTGWGTWLSDRYVSRWPILLYSDRGEELIGHLELETSELFIRRQLLQRMLLILVFSTLALFSLFAVFLLVIRRHVVQPIAMLMHLMDQYRLGRAEHTGGATQRPAGEIGRLYDSFEVMEDRLNTVHRQLTAAADEMARQLADQAEELSKAHEANMSLGISRAQESERRRLMRDMHDGIGSELASARIAVERGTLCQQDIAAFLSKCIADLHLIINVTGNEGGKLAEAMADWRYRVSRQLAGQPFRLVWDINLAGAPEISQRAALQVLRIAQEALVNATQHSGASEINIKAGHMEGALVLRVSDNGKGLSLDDAPSHSNKGKGLASMKARAREIGAKIDISFDGGCTVELYYRPEQQDMNAWTTQSVDA